MNKQRFNTYLKQPETMNEESLDDLKQIVKDYPFFTAGRIMLLRNLNMTNDSDYEKELPLTAIYAGSRSILYNYIFHQKPITKSEPENSDLGPDRHQLKPTLPSEPETDQSQLQPDDVAQEVAESEISVKEQTPDIVHLEVIPEEKRESSVHSFANWMDIMSKENNDAIPLDQKKQKSWDLIDNFIHASHKIPKAKDTDSEKPVSVNLADHSAQHHEEFMTETLAKIYIKQKHYNKAIQIFKKLSLKYPEKSIYFAGQIKIVEQLLNNEK